MDIQQDSRAVGVPEYTILWKFMPEGWATGISSREAPGIMPYFVDGEAFSKLQAKEEVELTPYGLLCGLLLSWFETSKFWADRRPDDLHGFLEDVIEDLRRLFQAPSTEEMLLDVAAGVRDKHGSLPASRMLTASNQILPQSSKIRCDLIQDVWMVLEEMEQVDRVSAFAFITKVYQGIDFKALNGRPQEAIEYINLVCLSLQGKLNERDRFFWQHASKRVQHPVLRERMLSLIEDVHPDFDSYRIWSRKQ